MLMVSKNSRSVKIESGMMLGMVTSVLVILGKEPSQVLLSSLEPIVDSQDLGVSVRSLVSFEQLSQQDAEAAYITMEKYPGIFSTGDSDIGQLGELAHQIELTDATPIYQKPRKVSWPVE